MYSRKYEKIFVLLKEELSGYGVWDRPLTGSCAIEIKNGRAKLLAHLQGLDTDTLCFGYRLFLTAAGIKKTYGMDCGVFDTSHKGQGTLKFEFDPDDICGSGIALEDINVMAVTVDGVFSANGVLAPIAGYIGGKVSWRQNFRVFVKQVPELLDMPIEEKTEEISAAEATENASDCEAAEDSVYATAEDFYGGFTAGDPHTTFTGILNRFRDQLQVLDDAGILNISDILGEDKEVKIAEKPQRLEQASIFEKNQSMTAISPSDGIEWVKIDIKQIPLMPWADVSDMRKCLVAAGYKKYKHLIAGRRQAAEGYEYFLGVPDRFSTDYCIQASNQGFSRFLTSKMLRSGDESYGYWVKEV